MRWRIWLGTLTAVACALTTGTVLTLASEPGKTVTGVATGALTGARRPVEGAVDPKLCLRFTEAVATQWKIHEVMYDYAVDYITVDTQYPSCMATVDFKVEHLHKEWGITSFDRAGYITITLSDNVPREMRKHVMCHELGHVMGLDHDTTPDSCMSVDHFSTTLSKTELRTVRNLDWDFWDAALTS